MDRTEEFRRNANYTREHVKREEDDLLLDLRDLLRKLDKYELELRSAQEYALSSSEQSQLKALVIDFCNTSMAKLSLAQNVIRETQRHSLENVITYLATKIKRLLSRSKRFTIRTHGIDRTEQIDIPSIVAGGDEPVLTKRERKRLQTESQELVSKYEQRQDEVQAAERVLNELNTMLCTVDQLLMTQEDSVEAIVRSSGSVSSAAKTGTEHLLSSLQRRKENRRYAIVFINVMTIGIIFLHFYSKYYA